MSRCKIEWIDETHVKISGIIDESSDFHEFVDNVKDEVWIDFSGVNRINSCGVREWTSVSYNMNSRIYYSKCTPPIVDQLSMVPEFMGQNALVDSVIAHFVCEECGHEEMQELKVGKDIIPGEEEYLEGPQRTCPVCGAEMEFDHNAEVYLDFLTVLSPEDYPLEDKKKPESK